MLSVTAADADTITLRGKADGAHGYRRGQRNVAGLLQENNPRGWHDRYGRVQWTEFADWTAVLQLVPREIRYLGIEVGAGSHAPSAPALVYQHRFGDCKDKALLMVALPEALGIEAAPALVNTDVTSGVARVAPTPHALNHVLVRVTVAGKTSGHLFAIQHCTAYAVFIFDGAGHLAVAVDGHGKPGVGFVVRECYGG